MKIILRNMLPVFLDKKASYVLSLLFLLTPTAYAEIAQTPLLLGSSENIPGNLVLTISAEYPTVISAANLGEYELNGKYAGYFDSDKCYDYVREKFTHHKFGTITGENGGGYFTPVNFDFKNKGTCSGKWSGHYLNWAGTQTIDPFRKALTGGYRVVDDIDKTILEKATRAGSGESFKDRTISLGLAGKVTSYGTDFSRLASSVKSGNEYQKNKTIQIIKETDKGRKVLKSDPEYYSVRVEVCKKDFLESNCKKYGSNYKPEGLLQEYANDIRYSIFSYLNVSNYHINGVLRI